LSPPFSRNETRTEKNEISTSKNVPEKAIMRALRNRFRGMMIQTIGFTERNTWNFFPHCSPETRLEVRKTRLNIENISG